MRLGTVLIGSLAVMAPLTAPPATGETSRACQEATLVFDHAKMAWTTTPCDTTLGEGQPAVPTVFVKQGQRVTVCIVGTNPLLYSVASVQVKEEDAHFLKSLCELVGSFGKVIQDVVTTAGTVDKATPDFFSTGANEIEHLEPAVDGVGRLLAGLAAARREAVAALQQLEFRPGQPPSPRPTLVRVAQLDVVAATFSKVRNSADALRNSQLLCVTPALRALSAAGGFPETDNAAAIGKQRQALASVEIAADSGCPADRLIPDLLQAREHWVSLLQALGKELTERDRSKEALTQARRRPSGNAVSNAEDNLAAANERVEARRSDVSKYAKGFAKLLKRSESVPAILKEADDLLAREGETRKVAADLVAFGVRYEAAEVNSWGIQVPVQGVAAWDKSKTYEVSLKASSPYATEVGRNPELTDVTLKYCINWVGENLIGVGVGLTYTPLQARTWAALPLGSDPNKKAPQVKSTDTRAGQLALFLNWRALEALASSTRDWAVKPGIEVGAGLDGESRAAFLGISFEVAKALRLGYGHTWQRVTVLNGQQEGVTEVKSDDEVRTRKVYRGRWYASLTFALDSLTLFKKE